MCFEFANPSRNLKFLKNILMFTDLWTHGDQNLRSEGPIVNPRDSCWNASCHGTQSHCHGDRSFPEATYNSHCLHKPDSHSFVFAISEYQIKPSNICNELPHIYHTTNHLKSKYPDDLGHVSTLKSSIHCIYIC